MGVPKLPNSYGERVQRKSGGSSPDFPNQDVHIDAYAGKVCIKVRCLRGEREAHMWIWIDESDFERVANAMFDSLRPEM